VSDALLAEYRQQQLAIRARLITALAQLWPALDPQRLDETFLAWAVSVAQTVGVLRTLASTLAGQYLQAERTRQGLPGEAFVVPAPALETSRILTSLAVTGPAFIKSAMAAGTPLQQAVDSSFGSTVASASRHVLDGGRETITASTIADPKARGWRRVNGSPDCKFCRDRVGKVLTDEHFATHDHCSCSAVPVFR
jgi:hypothetical protein